MDMLLILSYTAICVAIFKIFKIPLNKWSIPTAVLGGIVLIGALILLMNYNHPFTATGAQIYTTTPIMPGVRGRVTEVDAVPNTMMHKGDLLFKIDDTPFKAEVVRLQAALAKAMQESLRLDATYVQAQSNTEKFQADKDRTEREYQRYKKGYESGAFTEQQMDTARQNFKAAQAALKAAIAQEEAPRLAKESEFEGENTDVATTKAQLASAEFNLEQATVRAPTDGYVTQVALRPGAMAVPLPLAPVMTFVHAEPRTYVGAFRQNSLMRLQPGNEAEFLFRSIPGRVFKGHVVEILPAIAESQIQAGGRLLGTQALVTSGQVFVKLKIDDNLDEFSLPMGTNVEIAVYSHHFEHVSVMRKVLIRMKSWQNYLYLDH